MADTTAPAPTAGSDPIFVDEDEVQVVDVRVHLGSVNITGSEAEVIQKMRLHYSGILNRQVAALQGRKDTQSENHLTGIIVRVQETKTLANLAKIWNGHMKKPMMLASKQLKQDADTWTAFQKALPSHKLQAKFFKHFLEQAQRYEKAIKEDIIWCEKANQDLKDALFPKRLGKVKTEPV